MFKNYLTHIYKTAERAKELELQHALEKVSKNGTLLDVGCWDGRKTKWWAKAYNAKHTIGIDSIKSACIKAQMRGIKTVVCDLNNKWPIKSQSIDCVVSNLVIEHIVDVDNFISESNRVLKHGGYVVVSTNNLSSWHNIFSLFFGWAPFDLTNSSYKLWSIGNPLVVHKNVKSIYGSTFLHKCVYTIRWLKEWFDLYGLKMISSNGAGYYPFPSWIGKLDKTHAALIIMTFKKD